MVNSSLNKGNVTGVISKMRYWESSILCISQNVMTRNESVLTRWLIYDQKGKDQRIPKGPPLESGIDFKAQLFKLSQRGRQRHLRFPFVSQGRSSQLKCLRALPCFYLLCHLLLFIISSLALCFIWFYFLMQKQLCAKSLGNNVFVNSSLDNFENVHKI